MTGDGTGRAPGGGSGRPGGSGASENRGRADGRGAGERGADGRGADGHGSGGDRARPAVAGTLLAAALAGAALLGVGVAVGAAVPVAVGAAGATALALSVRLASSGRPVRVALGTALSVPAALGVLAGPALGPTPVVAACTVAAFGAAAGPLDAAGGGRMVEGLGVTTYALVPVGVAAIVSGAVPVLERAGALVLSGRAAPPGGGVAAAELLWSSLSALLAAGSLRAALRAVPATELAPGGRRETVRTVLDRVDTVVSAAAWIAGALALAGMAAWVAVALDPGSVPAGLWRTFGAVSGGAGARRALLTVGLLCLAAVALVRAVRWAGGTVLDRRRRGVAVLTGVLVAAAVVGARGRILRTALSAVPVGGRDLLLSFSGVLGDGPTVLLAVSVVLLSFVLAALAVPAVVGLGLAPERSVAPAVAAAGLVAAGALAADAAGPVVGFGVVAVAMVVYDVGEHAVGLGEAVGARAGTAPQAVHAAASVAVGVAAVALATALYSAVAGTDPGGAPALAGLAAAFLGALLLMAALRG